MQLAKVKDHVHQAISNALFCGVGWLRLDFNPSGDSMVAPYVTNDDIAEDMVSVCRVAPGFVHVDPTTAPHRLGTARYIRFATIRSSGQPVRLRLSNAIFRKPALHRFR